MPAPRARPRLSVVVIFHNMRREAMRTLYSLTPAYQRGVSADDYEVIAVDNASTEPLAEADIHAFGPNFRYCFHDTSSVSPVGAINRAVERADADRVAICIDGARILSPGILHYSALAFRAFESPFVCTLGWHLGSQVQNLSIVDGYGPAVEDRLLESIDWRRNGYSLFSVAALALSCPEGWFSPIAESNCVVLSKEAFLRLGGFHEGFQTPGGGLANPDFFWTASQAPDLTPVVLLGEGTFHQVHGGVATNVPLASHPMPLYQDEFARIRGRSYAAPPFTPHYLGHLPREARRFLPGQS